MLASCENCVRAVPLVTFDPEADPEARVGCRGPDHNWCGEWQVDPSIVPPPTIVDVPYVQQTGNVITCTMGNWTGEPYAYHYVWCIEGAEIVDGNGSSVYTFLPEDVGYVITCVVSATNVSGTTEAPPSNEVLIQE
jgi:hypothetical protein